MKEILMKMKKTFAILVFLLLPTAANADIVINVNDVGGNVVFSVTGSLDLTGATFQGSRGYGLGIIPGGSNWYLATGSGLAYDGYALTSFDGPFGTSTTYFDTPSSTSGDDFFIWGNGGVTPQVGVPGGYISGNAISSGMVFNGATIAGFTMIPGSYKYDLPNDTVTLRIGIPEPSSTAILGICLIGAWMRWRR